MLLMLPCYIVSCMPEGAQENGTTNSVDTAVPAAQTTAADTADTTVPEITELVEPETTAEPETTVLPETTSAPETTIPEKVDPPAPKDEYMSFVSSSDDSYLVVWPYSEKEFNVLASYGGGTETNLEGLAYSLYMTLKESKAASFAFSSDRLIGSMTVKDEWREILVGPTTREATKKVKAELDFDEFAIKVVGNDIVVTGLGYTTTKAAINKFSELLSFYKDTSSGSLVYRIPSDFSLVGKVNAYSATVLEVPRFKGGVLDSVTAGGDGGYVAIYTETRRSDFYSYLASLKGAGYSMYFENNLANNLYAVYTNGKAVINAYFLPYSSSVYIVVEDAGKVTLPSLENEYTNRGLQSSITQMKLNNVTDSNGQCHVFRLADGRFIIVDGGGNDKKDGKDDADNLLTLLYSLSGGSKPVIAAWFITHLHSDHYNVLLDFSENFTSKVTVENFIFNFPPDEMASSNTSGAELKVNEAMDRFEGAKKIKAHTGQKYNFANAKIEMLYAPEMLCPNYITFYNDSSLVFTVTIEGTKTLITGDASPNTSAMMCKMYGKYLQCDILQISHHGSYGCSVEYYTYTNPQKLALLPVGATQKVRLTGEKENVFVAKLVEIVPHYAGTRTFNLPYKK